MSEGEVLLGGGHVSGGGGWHAGGGEVKHFIKFETWELQKLLAIFFKGSEVKE